MNKKDAADVARYLTELRTGYQKVAASEGFDEKRRDGYQREIDRLTALAKAVRPSGPSVQLEADLVEVGKCACGQSVKVSKRYSMSVKGMTTVSCACQGRDCKRTNDVEIQMLSTVMPANWHLRDCFCGTPIYLRDDYGGGYGYGWYGLKGWSPAKNRTTTYTCRGCGCKWKLTIRFVEVDGSTRRRVKMLITFCSKRHHEMLRQENALARANDEEGSEDAG